MHRETPIGTQVYKVLFPYPQKKVDPSSWCDHIKANLIPEIRIANIKFYGEADSLEARFAGLDYSYPPHKRRLSPYPNHRRLFAAIDELGLTSHEIYELCCWEGTLFKKRQYERETGAKIEDTTSSMVPTPEADAAAALVRAEQDRQRAAQAQAQDETDDDDDDAQAKSDDGEEEQSTSSTTHQGSGLRGGAASVSEASRSDTPASSATLSYAMQRILSPGFRERYPELWLRAREYAQETYRAELFSAVQQGERVEAYADTLAERVISEILSTRA